MNALKKKKPLFRLSTMHLIFLFLLLVPLSCKFSEAVDVSDDKPTVNKSCLPTQSDYLGPYFVSNTPVLTNLNRFAKPGQKMRMSGEIRHASSPYTAIGNAKIEIWQTDGNGDYYPENNGDASDYRDSEIDLRGTIYSDQLGKYSVLTLVPGKYGFRPLHIHFKISAKGFKTLITQHYISSDGKSSCRSGVINRDQGLAVYNAPTIYLEKN